MTRLHDHYNNVVKPDLIKEFGYSNAMSVPRLDKIVINMGVGDAVNDRKKVEGAVNDMTAISGQKPVVTRAKKSVSNFKLRDGMAIGCKVTLRRDRMYEFLDRLVTMALPRVRDFRVCQAVVLTVMAITPWALKNKSCFLKLITIRSIKFVGWTLSFAQPLKRTMKPVPC